MVRKIGVLTTMLLIVGLVINTGDAGAIPIDIGIRNASFEITKNGDGHNYDLDEGQSTYTDDPADRQLPKWDRYPDANLLGTQGITAYDWYGAWNPSTSSNVLGEAGYDGNVPDGQNVAYIEIEPGLSGITGLQQTISDVSLSAGDYWLQVDVGNTKDYAFPEYWIEVEAEGTKFSGNNPIPIDDQFLTSEVHFSFTTDFAGDLTIRLLIEKLSSNDHTEIDFDNVRVSNTPLATPEPATMLLLGAGLIGLAGFGRKKLFRK